MKKIIPLLIVFFTGLLMLTGCSLFNGTKEFSSKGFKISLPSDFEEVQTDGFILSLETKKYVVLQNRESYRDVGTTSMTQYAKMVINLNIHAQGATIVENEIKDSDDIYISFEYDATIDDNGFSYFVVIFRDSDSFYLINFVSHQENYSKAKPKFLKWVETIKVGEDEEHIL